MRNTKIQKYRNIENIEIRTYCANNPLSSVQTGNIIPMQLDYRFILSYLQINLLQKTVSIIYVDNNRKCEILIRNKRIKKTLSITIVLHLFANRYHIDKK